MNDRSIIACVVWLAVWTGASFAAETPGSPTLVMERPKDGGSALMWKSRSGRAVRINDPRLTLEARDDKSTLPLKVALQKHSVRDGEAALEYALTLDEKNVKINGAATVRLTLLGPRDEDVLISRMETSFSEPVHANVTMECSFDVLGHPPGALVRPERNGFLRTVPFPPDRGEGGCFALGQAARGGPLLGMPVIGFVWDEPQGSQLAVSADPYCGGVLRATARKDGAEPCTRVGVTAVYSGSIVPLRSERRTLALEFHRKGADGILRSFYRTIPEIEPGPAWIHGVHLVYYDYLSENGEGWFKDLQALADRIPPRHRGRVAVCAHGWYDYFQQYAYDHEHKKLLKEWTAFPGTRKTPMSLENMHKRLKFARDLGFRVLLYFADGTNSDSGAPNFRKEFVLKDRDGKTFPGWKGPDSLGDPLMMDPSVPELRDWYLGYLKALLEEYARDVDGLVWDETFYIPTDFISYGQAGPAYADRAMMGLVAQLTQMVQSYHDRNPDLVFLASDLGQTNYALVAHGTYQDSAMRESAWGPSMFSNYRNCLWSCNWYPLGGDKNNQIAAEKYGLPQGLSNGWEDNCGPSRMPPELLDAVLKRFTKNVEPGRQRLRYLTPSKAENGMGKRSFQAYIDALGDKSSYSQVKSAEKSILDAGSEAFDDLLRNLQNETPMNPMHYPRQVQFRRLGSDGRWVRRPPEIGDLCLVLFEFQLEDNAPKSFEQYLQITRENASPWWQKNRNRDLHDLRLELARASLAKAQECRDTEAVEYFTRVVQGIEVERTAKSK